MVIGMIGFDWMGWAVAGAQAPLCRLVGNERGH